MKIRIDRGFTLLEITVVIAILLLLIGTTVTGVAGYVQSTRRSNCLVQQNGVLKEFTGIYLLNEGRAILNSSLETGSLTEGRDAIVDLLSGESTHFENTNPLPGHVRVLADCPGMVPFVNRNDIVYPSGVTDVNIFNGPVGNYLLTVDTVANIANIPVGYIRVRLDSEYVAYIYCASSIGADFNTVTSDFGRAHILKGASTF